MAEPRRSWRWAGGLAALASAAVLAAQLHGRASRLPFVPPPEMQGRRWGAVADAAEAYRVWESAGVRGRRLVILTGRWSRPRPLGDPGAVDVAGALFAAAQAGIARRLDVVLPPAAWQQRRAEVSTQKDLEPGDGAFQLHYQGLERRFSRPEAFRAADEEVLLLVEPSWFQAGAPEVQRFLAASGLRADLALVALDDPAAGDGERAAAARLAEAQGAVRLEVAR